MSYIKVSKVWYETMFEANVGNIVRARMVMSKLNFLYLDMDGVMNSGQSCEFLHKTDEVAVNLPYRYHVDCLNYILRKTDALLVISSTWRRGFTLNSFETFLEACGVRKCNVVGFTPSIDDYFGQRGKEIATWHHTYAQDGDKMVILDDDGDMACLCSRLVQTNSEHGLTMEKAEKVIELFC